MTLRAGQIRAKWSFESSANVEFEIWDGDLQVRLHQHAMKPWASAEDMESEARIHHAVMKFLPVEVMPSLPARVAQSLSAITSDLKSWWEETGRQQVKDLEAKAREGRRRERVNQSEQKLKRVVGRLLEAGHSLEQIHDLVNQAAVDGVHKQ